MASANGQKAKLARIGPRLEGGIIFTTTGEESVYIPVGCLHSVFTLVGGFLVAIDFVTPRSCKTFAAMLEAGLDRESGESKAFQNDVFYWFLASIDLALCYPLLMEGIEAWVDAIERIREWVERNKNWGKKASRVWDTFLGTVEGKKVRCPCGEQRADEIFKVHLKRKHWWGKGSKVVTDEKKPIHSEAKRVVKRKVQAKEEDETEKRVRRSKRVKR